MALLKLTDIAPNYQEIFGNDDIIGLSVYSDTTDEKTGIVKDILVDETEGKFRYLIVDLGFWILGKKVLLPIGLARINFTNERVYAKGITKEQAEKLPEFNDHLKLDSNYEEQLRTIYGTTASYTLMNPVVPVAPLGPIAINQAAILNEPSGMTTPVASEQANKAVDDRATYNYHHYPDLYELNDTDHPRLKLYEQRLFANKNRVNSKK